MNNIIDQTTMTSDACLSGGGLEVAAGKLSIAQNAITNSRLESNSVTSDKIVDGTIVNADINASAAIAGTKISPNFGAQNIVTTGTIDAGATNLGATFLKRTNTSIEGGDLAFAKAIDNTVAFTIDCFGSTSSPDLRFITGSSVAAVLKTSGNVGIGTSNPIAPLHVNGQTSTNSDAELTITGSSGYINFHNSLASGAFNGIVSNGDKSIIFSDGSSDTGSFVIAPWASNISGIRINSSGNVGICKASPSTALDVNGTVTATAFSGPLTGNSTTATRLQTARDIAISGDVTGTATSFNGSANISIPVTIDNLSVTTAKIADGAVNQAKASNMLVPSGAIMAFAMNSAPTGWLAANGSSISTGGANAALFAAIGYTYGGSGGSFNLPDLRGYFVRGAGTNGDGTASGTFGTKQANALGSHTHTVTAGQQNGTSSGCGTDNTFQKAQDTSCGTVTTSSAGSTETRPNNIAMLYCIKI
jgi:microcystin-dependent protein